MALSAKPQILTENARYYEQARGLDLVVEPSIGPSLIVHIPWKKLRNSLARKDAELAKRQKR